MRKCQYNALSRNQISVSCASPETADRRLRDGLTLFSFYLQSQHPFMVKTNFNSKRDVKVPIFPFQPPSSVLQWPLSRFLWYSFTSSWSVTQLTYRWALAIRALRLPKERCFPVWTRRFPSPTATGCGLSLPDGETLWGALAFSGGLRRPPSPGLLPVQWYAVLVELKHCSISSCLTRASAHPSLRLWRSPSSSPLLSNGCDTPLNGIHPPVASSSSSTCHIFTWILLYLC